jgi:serine protease AprX
MSESGAAIDILVHKDAETAQALASSVIAIDGVVPEDLSVSYRQLRVHAHPEALDKIARLDGVKYMEPVVKPTFGNDLARVEMRVDRVVDRHRFTGEGQVISVNDSGFDMGDLTNTHPAFDNRVAALLPVARPNQTNDPNGHGTHVCGSAVGSGTSPSMGGQIQGTAPGASLVVSSIMNSAGAIGLPPDLYAMFKTPYTLYNSRVSSNSWYTPGTQTAYDLTARAVDNFCWDHKDCVVLFCAGNEGADSTKKIGSVSGAKNCITVGATLGSRPNDGTKYVPGAKAMDPFAVATYSSRGPTLEGRIKPDVVAPGTAILSTASRDPSVTAQARQKYGPSTDPLWMYMSGTSMSTPLTAGCCAVLRQITIARGGASPTNPSAALIKALVINGSLSLGETHADSSKAVCAPNSASGFGIVDIERSFVPHETFWHDNTVGLAAKTDPRPGQGSEAVHPVILNPASGKRGLKVTLAYTDRPGPDLENKLSLTVVTPAKTFHDTQMQENNVQQIIARDLAQDAEIRVTAERINRLDDVQPYAVVWRFLD